MLRLVALVVLAALPAPGLRGPLRSSPAPLRRVRPRDVRALAAADDASSPPPAAASGARARHARGGGAPPDAALRPVCLGVFAHMLGEGVAISTIPLHLAAYGASPLQIGAATSAFALAQMSFCPLLVRLSGRYGRARVLRGCTVGAAVSGLVIALSSTTAGVIAGRFFAGVFAASVPVAQAAAADGAPPGKRTARALSRVSAAAQAGVVVGPALSACLQPAAGALGLPPHLRVRAVFVLTSLATIALSRGLSAAVTAGGRAGGVSGGGRGAEGGVAGASGSSRGAALAPDAAAQRPSGLAAALAAASAAAARRARRALPPLPQLWLRIVALAVGWALTLSVSTHCLFGARVLRYGQPQLSATFSAGAALTVATQLLLYPRLLSRFSEHALCALGLGVTGAALGSMAALLRQPWHTGLYMLNRVGAGVADTSTAALVAAASATPEARARHLAMIQSTRAAARVVTPMVSGALLARSAGWARAPGALPYHACAALALALVPVPLLLRRWTGHGGGRVAIDRL